MSEIQSIPEDRPLRADEQSLIHWMLENAGASAYCSQLEHTRVVARCSCGCASIDLSVSGLEVPPGTPMKVIADYQYNHGPEALCGAFVFIRAGQLAGMEVWSIDGKYCPATLPSVEQLTLIE